MYILHEFTTISGIVSMYLYSHQKILLKEISLFAVPYGKSALRCMGAPYGNYSFTCGVFSFCVLLGGDYISGRAAELHCLETRSLVVLCSLPRYSSTNSPSHLFSSQITTKKPFACYVRKKRILNSPPYPSIVETYEKIEIYEAYAFVRSLSPLRSLRTTLIAQHLACFLQK